MNPFANPGADYFSRSRFSDGVAGRRAGMAAMAGQAMANAGSISRQRQLSRFAAQQAKSAKKSSTIGAIGGAVASVAGALI